MGPIFSYGDVEPHVQKVEDAARHVGKTTLGCACLGIAENDVRVTRRDALVPRLNARRSQCPPRFAHTHGLRWSLEWSALGSALKVPGG
jgi:hypothetical protein